MRNAQTERGTEGGSQGGSCLTVFEIGNWIAAAYPAFYGEEGPAKAKWRKMCVRLRNVTDMCHRRARVLIFIPDGAGCVQSRGQSQKGSKGESATDCRELS